MWQNPILKHARKSCQENNYKDDNFRGSIERISAALFHSMKTLKSLNLMVSFAKLLLVLRWLKFIISVPNGHTLKLQILSLDHSSSEPLFPKRFWFLCQLAAGFSKEKRPLLWTFSLIFIMIFLFPCLNF